MHFDSLADLASFGVAPAVLAYTAAFSHRLLPGLIVTFIPVLCAAIRLARFNASADDSERDFAGLSAPLHAALVASFIIMNFAAWERVLDPALLGGLLLLTSALMVSRLPLPRLPRFTFREPGFNLAKLAFLVAALAFAAANPARHLFFVLVLVVVSGFVAGSVRMFLLRGNDLSAGGGAATIYGGER
jgi:CDP-diacylglycerol--serine O-phosphatidyltransferase